MMTSFAISLFCIIICVEVVKSGISDGVKDFFPHSGLPGTQHGRDENDPHYYSTNADVSHLPFITGFKGTSGTFRFLNIVEQTAVMIGEHIYYPKRNIPIKDGSKTLFNQMRTQNMRLLSDSNKMKIPSIHKFINSNSLLYDDGSLKTHHHTEAKHGLWRVQDNGMVREYRKKGKIGLAADINPNDLNLDENTKAIIRDNYAHYIPEESWSGYKYPDDKISKGNYDGLEGYLNYIDLSIYHPKYGGKYNTHVPIDLPYWYCTMSQNDYPYVNNSWKFARAQPQANKIGPLGSRAGLDIKENVANVLRFDLFADASIWANVGVGDAATDAIVKDLNELKQKAQTVNYKRADLTKTKHELYLIERMFFNKPYLFVALIIENMNNPSEYSYVRPDGPYWNGLIAQGYNTTTLNTKPPHYPKIDVKDYPTTGESSFKTAIGLPIYGIHHPNRIQFKKSGGACPSRGGDWAYYPWSNSGAGWPTNYEEITPLCEAVLIDIKMWRNLWIETWNDEAFALGNAGFSGALLMNYTADSNIYGKYTDPYLTNEVNPFMIDLTTSGQIVEVTDRKPNPVVFKLKYQHAGTAQSYNDVQLYKAKEECEKCETDPVKIQLIISNPEPETTTKPIQVIIPQANPESGYMPIANPESGNLNSQATPEPTVIPEPEPETYKDKTTTVPTSDDDNDIPDWGIAALVLLSLILLINLLAVITFFCFASRDRRNENGVEQIETSHASKETKTSGVDNPGLQR